MTERPILFQGAMVRAILNGSKTQTRRLVKPQPPSIEAVRTKAGIDFAWIAPTDRIPHWRVAGPVWAVRDLMGQEPHLRCPYGQPGDRLWVRENGWQRPERTPRMMREGADTWEPYYFDADCLSTQDSADFRAWGFKRRPSIHMPRAASRITLEITGVRVERLQDISEADAIAEGIEPDVQPGDPVPLWRNYSTGNTTICPIYSYQTLWESINGDGSWAANPWVWCVEFSRTKS